MRLKFFNIRKVLNPLSIVFCEMQDSPASPHCFFKLKVYESKRRFLF